VQPGKNTENEKKKRAPQQQRTATGHPLDHRTPALSGPATHQFSNGGQSREHVGSLPRLAPSARATRNPAARRTSRGRCANDLFLVAEPIVIDRYERAGGMRHRIIFTTAVGGCDGTRVVLRPVGSLAIRGSPSCGEKVRWPAPPPNADSARPDPDRGLASQQQAVLAVASPRLWLAPSLMVRVHLLALDWTRQGSGPSGSTVPDAGDSRGSPCFCWMKKPSRVASSPFRWVANAHRAVAGNPWARLRGGWRRFAVVGQTGTAAGLIGIPRRHTPGNETIPRPW
jgi:hypothetical protein